MDKMSRIVHALLILGIISAKAKSSPVVETYKKAGRLIVDFDWPEMKSGIPRLPHQTSCNHFYSAVPNGRYKIRKCPRGDIFDFVSLKCRRETLSQCWSSQFDRGYKPLNPKKHFNCPVPWGRYPDVLNCKEYYQCHGRKALRKSCPDLMLFDRVESRCVLESKATCADISDLVEKYYKCPYMWGTFPYSRDCSKYHECIKGIPTLRACNKNFLFDAISQECRPREEVHCGHRDNPYDLPAYSSASPEAFTGKATEKVITENSYSEISTDNIAEKVATSSSISEISSGILIKEDSLFLAVSTESAPENINILSSSPDAFRASASEEKIIGRSYPEESFGSFLPEVSTGSALNAARSFSERPARNASEKLLIASTYPEVSTGSSPEELSNKKLFSEVSTGDVSKKVFVASSSPEIANELSSEEVTNRNSMLILSTESPTEKVFIADVESESESNKVFVFDSFSELSDGSTSGDNFTEGYFPEVSTGSV